MGEFDSYKRNQGEKVANYIVLPDGSKCYAGPTCLRHGNTKPTLSSDFLTKPFQEQLEEMEKLKNPLAVKEPKEIDEALAALYENYFRENHTLKLLEQYLETSIVREQKATHEGMRTRFHQQVEDTTQKVEEAKATVEAIMREMVPYQVEYKRRPWTRGFLVKNANGHVHKDMYCSTCTPSTQYLWLTDYSGANEEELVADAGEKACTVCYPSAPVNVLNRPANLRNPVLAAEQQKKNEAQAAKLKKQADAQAKAITSPDGSPLKDDYGWVLKTVTSAENFASETQSYLRAIEEGKYEVHNPEWVEKRKIAYQNIMEALAVKKGLTVEELNTVLKKKFDAKYKRDWS